MPAMPTAPLVLIDGHALAYRMYFALENTRMQNKAGEPTWAIYGFFSALFTLLKNQPITHMAVAFDAARESFRTELYKEYKANRATMPDAMRQQMGSLIEGVKALGIPIYQVDGVEADDVIGTLARLSVEQGHPVEVLTGDQDSFQLVDKEGQVSILIPSRKPKEGLKTYDWQGVYEKWQIFPDQVVDYKALRGDASDNIPGVPGIGEKTAASLLNDYKTLDGVYSHIEELKGKKKLYQNLIEFKEQAYLSQKLAQIICDVPEVSLSLDDCRLCIPSLEELKDWMGRYELRQFLNQLEGILYHFDCDEKSTGNGSEPSSIKEAAESTAETNQHRAISDAGEGFPACEPQIITKAELLHQLEVSMRKAGGFAIDLETTALDTKDAQPVGIAIAIAAGLKQEDRQTEKRSFLYESVPAKKALTADSPQPATIETVYIPVGHCAPESGQTLALLQAEAQGQSSSASETPQQLDWESVVKPWLASLLGDASLYKVVHNLKYERNVFTQWGLPFQGLVLDTMLLSYVLQPERRHGLKALALEELGLTMQTYEEVAGKGKKQLPFAEVPIERAARYAGTDAYATLCLAFTLLPRLETPQKALLWDMELPLAWVLAEMERTGITLDADCLLQLSRRLDKELSELEASIYEMAEQPFNLNSPKQVGEILFDKLGIAPLRKTAGKNGYSTDAKVLEALRDEHAIISLLLDYRQLFKLKSTYIDTLPKLVHSRTGRLHTSFNQTVAATGRLSSSDPNLQNIPVRTEMGRLIRQAFIPAENGGSKQGTPWKLISADYSQIELRLLAHLSRDRQLLNAFHQGEDIHTKTAALVLGLDPDQVSKEQRYKAKAVNFGIVYGQTAHGLSQQLGISRAEAADFIERYFATYPGVKSYIETIKALAHEQGWVETLCGRRRHFALDLASSNRSVREFAERAAFNTPIQGSAADLLKLAMLRLSDKLQQENLSSRLLLQVHDEVVLEAPEDELDTVQQLIRWAMELDQPLDVPLLVDMQVANNWMET